MCNIKSCNFSNQPAENPGILLHGTPNLMTFRNTTVLVITITFNYAWRTADCTIEIRLGYLLGHLDRSLFDDFTLSYAGLGPGFEYEGYSSKGEGNVPLGLV